MRSDTNVKLDPSIALEFRLIKDISNNYETVVIVLSMNFKVCHADHTQKNHQCDQTGWKCRWYKDTAPPNGYCTAVAHPDTIERKSEGMGGLILRFLDRLPFDRL